ncbi:MAG: L-serine ammonia-lyase, iron-sulfur-dependent subunit beta [Lachnospiraceae bacterium]|nr:L-serine ammonia-lyase, iron-sulfur-dependent subunit beta [Lachnospiraceae bacterium]
MNIFDIVGPVMVGPSSSHTAGAVRIGRVSKKLYHAPIENAEILLHGSFASSGRGHGTDKALVAGLLGLSVDDARIPDAMTLAKEHGLHVSFGTIDLGEDAHPNSVCLKLSGKAEPMEIVASSIGGGRIMINAIDGLCANFSGDSPTLIVHNLDQPGHVAEVTSMLQHKAINIATMQLYRNGRGGHAVMVIECDQEVPEESLSWLSHLEGVEKVTYYSPAEDEE